MHKLLLSTFVTAVVLNGSTAISDNTKYIYETSEFVLCHDDASLCNLNPYYYDYRDVYREIYMQNVEERLQQIDDILADQPSVNDALQVLSSFEYGHFPAYNLSETLIVQMKIHRLNAAYLDLFYHAIDLLQQSTLRQSDPLFNQIWLEREAVYDTELAAFEASYQDPWRERVWEIGFVAEEFVESGIKLKAALPAAWHISTATFLAPYEKTVKTIKNTLSVINNTWTFLHLVPGIFELLQNDSSADSATIRTRIEDFRDALQLLGQEEYAASADLILTVDEIIAALDQLDALQTIKAHYAQSEFVSHPVTLSENYLRNSIFLNISKLVTLMGDISGLNDQPGIGDAVTITNDLVNLFGSRHIDHYRTNMEKASLGVEYLRLYLERFDITARVYAHFMVNYHYRVASNLYNTYKAEFDAEQAALEEPQWVATLDESGTLYSPVITEEAPGASEAVLTKTGQVESYDALGNLVTDGSIKDDGYYQTGVEPDFTRDAVNEIVTDNHTGLMWQDDAAAATVTKPWVTQANYDAGNYSDTSGDTAATYCKALTLGGYSDWRLPTRRELESIVDFSRNMPAIAPVFQNTSWMNNYWSSTTTAGNTGSAWIALSLGGSLTSSYKNNSSNVRCVWSGE